MDISICTSKTCKNRKACLIHESNISITKSVQQAYTDRSSFCDSFEEELSSKSIEDSINQETKEL